MRRLRAIGRHLLFPKCSTSAKGSTAKYPFWLLLSFPKNKFIREKKLLHLNWNKKRGTAQDGKSWWTAYGHFSTSLLAVSTTCSPSVPFQNLDSRPNIKHGRICFDYSYHSQLGHNKSLVDYHIFSNYGDITTTLGLMWVIEERLCRCLHETN
jgi:hypothetical protein